MAGTGRASIEWMLACAIVLSALGIGAGGCADDLPPGMLPAQIVSYEPSSGTTGTTGGGTTPVTTLSITDIQPVTATAETTLTFTGTGFGTNPNALALVYTAASASVIQITTANPTVATVQRAGTVDSAQSTVVRARLPADAAPGTVQIGVRDTAASTSAQTVRIVALSGARTFNPIPRVTARLTGAFAPGNTFTLEATGLAPRLSDNRVRFFAGGAEVGNTTPQSITFTPGGRSQLIATTPSSITASIGTIRLDVQGRLSASFP